MSTEHPNAAIVKAVWKTVADSDVAAMRELCREDLVWHGTGRSLWGRDHESRRASLEFLIEVGERVDELRSDLERVLADDEGAIAIVRMHGRRGERVLDTRVVMIFRIEDGLVAEITSVAFDQYATDEFYA